MWVFTRTLDGSSYWTRFELYACRVRSLTLHNEISSSIFQSVFTHWPRTIIFPNLQALRLCTGRAESFTVLAHPQLTHLDVAFCPVALMWWNATVQSTSTERIKGFLHDLPAKAPYLRTLKLATMHSLVRHLQDSLCNALSKLKELEHVTLPVNWFSGEIISTLSELPRLKSVQYLIIFRGEENIGDFDRSHWLLFSENSLSLT